ncbi:Endogenous retrovirus group 3 member 1 Env polyprotein [Plecturocebus cupreus]
MRNVIYRNQLALDYLLAAEGAVCGIFNLTNCCLHIDDQGQAVEEIVRHNQTVTRAVQARESVANLSPGIQKLKNLESDVQGQEASSTGERGRPEDSKKLQIRDVPVRLDFAKKQKTNTNPKLLLLCRASSKSPALLDIREHRKSLVPEGERLSGCTCSCWLLEEMMVSHRTHELERISKLLCQSEKHNFLMPQCFGISHKKNIKVRFFGS